MRSKKAKSALKEAQEIGALLQETRSTPEIAERFKEHPLVQSLSETFQASPELILKAFEILDRKSRKE